MKNIALIGAGELGSRHLQSLAKSDFSVSLQVVDPNDKSLEIAKKRYLEIPDNNFIKKIEFINSIEKLDSELDLVIVASSSNVRLKILQDLLDKYHKQVQSIILEKVLFQSLSDLQTAQVLLKKHKVNCWVNCPKRSFESISYVKKMLLKEDFLECKVVGNNWGLLCNSIHFIDTLAFILNSTSYEVCYDQLIKKIHHSKRAGFIEMFGTLEVFFSDRGKLTLTSIESDLISFSTFFESKNFSMILEERSGKLNISHKTSGLKEELSFRHPFQSEMTSKVAKDILFGSQCKLTTFEESALLHTPILKALITLYEALTESTTGSIPIT